MTPEEVFFYRSDAATKRAITRAALKRWHPGGRWRRPVPDLESLALWGAKWKRPAARFLGVDARRVRRWASDQLPTPEWVIERLAYERARRKSMYRIHWRSFETGATGRGEPLTSRLVADAWVEQQNLLWAGRLHHWVVEEEASDAK